MSNLEKFKALFPLQGSVTKKIIKDANRNSNKECAGALTLKKALKKNIDLIDLSWGDESGHPTMKDSGGIIRITTKENVGFMYIDKPQKVVFVIEEPYLKINTYE